MTARREKELYAREDIEKVKAFYNDFLASEPGKYSPRSEFDARYQSVLNFVKNIHTPGCKILDVGCGTGMAAERLKVYGKVHGVDISDKSIEMARKRLEDAKVGMAEEIPYDDVTFDIVVCTEVIEHVLNPEKVFSEFKRVLVPGGYLILTTPNPYYWAVLLHKFICIFKKKSSTQIIEKMISPAKMHQYLAAHQFYVFEFDIVYFKPFFLSKIMRKISPNLFLYQVYLTQRCV
ncbi:MAG: class I SAM-dependent methyltransferase [Thermodesulfobacteriota bacterium]|jgi:ubiquinone/menaquinone biosynthesis C-methylase UbiE|nr:MAG: class I SAM-dependent methyltransferase [Thermodesulfobacteriota bacterium]